MSDATREDLHHIDHTRTRTIYRALTGLRRRHDDGGEEGEVFAQVIAMLDYAMILKERRRTTTKMMMQST